MHLHKNPFFAISTEVCEHQFSEQSLSGEAEILCSFCVDTWVHFLLICKCSWWKGCPLASMFMGMVFFYSFLCWGSCVASSIPLVLGLSLSVPLGRGSDHRKGEGQGPDGADLGQGFCD